jgi:hypothetical protein
METGKLSATIATVQLVDILNINASKNFDLIMEHIQGQCDVA